MKPELLGIVFLIWASCSAPSDTFTVSNTSDTDWDHKNIIIHSSELSVESGSLPILTDSEGSLIPSQVNDINGDGLWDELAFQLSVPARGSKIISWKGVPEEDYPEFESKTQVYLGYSPDRDNHFQSVEQNVRPADHKPQSTPFLYQYEGPGWENNLVAFRSYFDSRNGKDIFGKRTQEMITHSIGIDEDYHSLQLWGMDILKVGNSLGAGALAIVKNGHLERLAETEHTEFRKLIEGPVRSVFELKYSGWKVDGTDYELTERITIWANKRWYQSEITFQGETTDTLATGIVNLKGAEVSDFDESGFNILMTHGAQTEIDDFLGMALLIPTDNFISFAKAPVTGDGITHTELAFLKRDDQYSFYFFVGWEKESAEFSESAYLKTQLTEASKQLSARPDITFN